MISASPAPSTSKKMGKGATTQQATKSELGGGRENDEAWKEAKLDSLVLKGYDKPATSKKHNYMVKSEKDEKPDKGEERRPGPQQYRLRHDLTEARPRGGTAAFGIPREQFL